MINVLYFSTEHCGPCKMFKPIVTEVASETGIQVQFIDATVDSRTQEYRVTAVPTLIVMKNGEPVFRNTGVMAKTKLIDTLQNLS